MCRPEGPFSGSRSWNAGSSARIPLEAPNHAAGAADVEGDGLPREYANVLFAFAAPSLFFQSGKLATARGKRAEAAETRSQLADRASPISSRPQ